MKVLWITNIVFPEALASISKDSTLKSSGGWMLGAASAFTKLNDISLAIASCSNLVKDLTFIKGKEINHYILPIAGSNTKVNKKYEPFWKIINDDFNPDIVHIHGTEYSHGLAYIEACGADKVVVSIQGLTSIFERYYYGGLSSGQVFKSLTLRDFGRGTLFKGHRDFVKRGKYEKEMLLKSHHIIGRTEWDKAHVWSVNPDATYHFCNETLREEFYDAEKWDYSKCQLHTIFASTAGFPIKGFHQLLKAMPLILRAYPDASIRVAGLDITRSNSGLKGKLIRTGYGKYLSGLINRYGLIEKVTFTGSLDAKEMKKEYLQANVFVCPSSIENSPNSLCEAQILGVPNISSYVGGTMTLTSDSSMGELYRFEEVEMLAWKICKMFSESQRFDNSEMIHNANLRHNREVNANKLLKIYQQIRNA